MGSDLNNGLPSILGGLHWHDAYSEEIALLEGCVANPEDIAPQLVFADWLDSHDHDKVADFIRLQCGFWPNGDLPDARRQEAVDAARAYWQPKFNGGGVECEITPESPEFAPLLEHVRLCRYGRSFVKGLPSRVTVGIRTLHKLFDEGREQSVLCLATDLRAPCEPSESSRGAYGNYGFYGAAFQKARDLNERIHNSPFATGLTKLNLFGIHSPKLPFGRVQTEEPSWNSYPSREKTTSYTQPGQAAGGQS